MHKLILISVLALASVTAEAGQNRGLVLASGEVPHSSERIESVNPQERKANVKPEPAKPVKVISTPVRQASTPPTQASKPVRQAYTPPAPASKSVRQASRPQTQVSKLVRQASMPANRIDARGYQNEEAEARRIAATYGVSW